MVDVRAELGALMRATLADEAAHQDWTYHAVRPCPVPGSWKPGQKVVGDCSKGVQFLCRWVGTDDPMGQAYGPYGNSQTLWLHLQHLANEHDLLVGDVVTFGRDGDEHAAMVLEAPSAENGWNPLAWSFGHQGAPNTYRLSVDRRPQQYLRLPVPVYVATPEDRLRAETGFWSWMQWRLGEGDWRWRYVKADPTVRPNVPKVIPAGWWLALAKFLAARKKGNP